jgi:nicotinate-nucleotide pyrophosphorylase (carboxylating)
LLSTLDGPPYNTIKKLVPRFPRAFSGTEYRGHMDFNTEQIRNLVKTALEEDISTGDITSIAIFDGTERSSAYITAKQAGIVCGTELVKLVYRILNGNVESTVLIPDGTLVKKGDIAVRLQGPTRSLLEGERTALNFFQRMSGIATKTSNIVKLVEGTDIGILDTRKTLPGFRTLDKYAVACGGGTNHRIGLYDMVLIKDNHIKAAGSITNAVSKVRDTWGTQYKVETETTTIDEVKEALESKSDIIMLDNMDKETMRKALEIIDGKAKTEISGNMSPEKILSLKDLHVDYISIGALTHSVEAFDWSMKFE